MQTLSYIPISGVRCVQKGDSINVRYWPKTIIENEMKRKNTQQKVEADSPFVTIFIQKSSQTLPGTVLLLNFAVIHHNVVTIGKNFRD